MVLAYISMLGKKGDILFEEEKKKKIQEINILLQEGMLNNLRGYYCEHKNCEARKIT